MRWSNFPWQRPVSPRPGELNGQKILRSRRGALTPQALHRLLPALKRVSVSLAVVGVALAALACARQEAGPVVSQPEATPPAEAERPFESNEVESGGSETEWTEEKMRNAEPYPMPTPIVEPPDEDGPSTDREDEDGTPPGSRGTN